MNLIGNCTDEKLVESIFGSVSEFARQVEENGDDFTYGKIKVEYDRMNDVHSFYEN